MISEIISRAACLAELTSNPKSFSNCPDLHGGVPGLPGGKVCMEPALGKKSRPAGSCSLSKAPRPSFCKEARTLAAFTTNEEEQNAMFDQQRLDVATHRKGVLISTK